MNWGVAGFFISAVLLLYYFVWLVWRRRTAAQEIPAPGCDHWSWKQLILASFLTLFAELALIRWIGTEIRIFAYVKNLALLLCFLGFGMGCALARRPVRWRASATALLGLLMVVRWPWYGKRIFEDLSESMGAAQDVQIWASDTVRHWPDFLVAVVMVAALLLLVACIFMPLGQVVSQQLELAARPLQGYSWNLAASLLGILTFFAVSWFTLGPAVWMAVIFLGMGLLQPGLRRALVFTSLSIPAALLLHDVSNPEHFTIWTSYQTIDYERLNFRNGEFWKAIVEVNHTGYQFMVDLSPEFLHRHPKLLSEAADRNPYNLPFSFAPLSPRVLIVGSGTGNDVAAAVRHESVSVDAVEIDPVILALGKTHPEHPYSAPQVSVHVTDARAYMKRAPGTYDLILFGLLDSHTLADYSNMRIDNFVYTKESFQEAKSLLAPGGVVFIKFQVDRPWLGKRLVEMLTQVFGKPPVTFVAGSSYTAGATCFAISASGQVERQLATDSALHKFVSENRPDFLDSPAVPVTTDDWPYLYQQGRWLPGIFVSIELLVLLLGTGLYLQIPEARQRVPSLFFFSMGAGFLLLETQIVSRLALYFGTTWQVNGIVIGAILVALLVANTIVERQTKPWPRHWYLAGLLAGLMVTYIFPFHRLPGSPTLVGWIAAAVFTVPVFFAGLLFASEFRVTDSPSAALGTNMLGAVVGGLLENLSLVIGLKALVLAAMALYVLAGVGLITDRKLALRRDESVYVPVAGG
jgi:spermidine synthase